jgi:integrase
MAAIKYFIQSKSNPAGIYVRLSEGRTINAKAKTKFAINPIDWSSKKGQPKNPNEASFKKLNKDLKKLSVDLLEYYNNSVGAKTINTQWLKDFINPPIEAEGIPNKLVQYFDYYALHKKSSIGASTLTKLNVNKHLIERFQKHSKTEYFIKDIDANFKLRFEDYCKKEKYAKNTIARTIKFIKTICYHARNNGITTHFQLESIAADIEKVEKIFLTPDELDKIQNKKLNSESLTNARDWLIISCETGQRVSDFLRFNKQQIRHGGKAPMLEFKQVKTGKLMSIPLTKKVMSILEKRNGEFPRQISDQRYNDYIKDVCKIAEINEKTKGSRQKTDKKTKITRKESGVFEKWELVTSHIGRRSFASNNYGRIPTSILTYMTGHAKESTFLEYIGKTDTEKGNQAAEYFN